MDTKGDRGWDELGDWDWHVYTTIHEIDNEWAPNCVAQGTLLSAVWWPKWEGNPKKWGCICTHICMYTYIILGFPGGSAGKESACNAGDLGLIPGWGRSPGEGNGYSLQYSGLENSMDCIVHRVAKSQTRLSDFHFLFTFIYTYVAS